MHPLPARDHESLRRWFTPERPGPVIWAHVLRTRHGYCAVDRWPEPRTVLAEVGANYSVRGDPDRLGELAGTLAGFVEAPPSWLPALRRIHPGLHVWDRMIFELADRPAPPPAVDAEVRRLGPGDEGPLAALSEDVRWIAATWGGAAGLAADRVGWGAFVDGRLASVAVPFFLGERFEDIGVVTEPEHRGRGLSPACASGVITDALERGHRASWSTSTDNLASIRVAERLGFRLDRRDVLYLVRTPLPGVANRPGDVR
jgi:RimJ/RimL family protein N-acetyltransferase